MTGMGMGPMGPMGGFGAFPPYNGMGGFLSMGPPPPVGSPVIPPPMTDAYNLDRTFIPGHIRLLNLREKLATPGFVRTVPDVDYIIAEFVTRVARTWVWAKNRLGGPQDINELLLCVINTLLWHTRSVEPALFKSKCDTLFDDLEIVACASSSVFHIDMVDNTVHRDTRYQLLPSAPGKLQTRIRPHIMMNTTLARFMGLE